ncbi:hypothetical protein OHA02_52155 [Streptomyces phaeochromogenes]|nr:hypothetical protein [Streptomyces phaeochromogenes]
MVSDDYDRDRSESGDQQAGLVLVDAVNTGLPAASWVNERLPLRATVAGPPEAILAAAPAPAEVPLRWTTSG